MRLNYHFQFDHTDYTLLQRPSNQQAARSFARSPTSVARIFKQSILGGRIIVSYEVARRTLFCSVPCYIHWLHLASLRYAEGEVTVVGDFKQLDVIQEKAMQSIEQIQTQIGVSLPSSAITFFNGHSCACRVVRLVIPCRHCCCASFADSIHHSIRS